MFPLLLLPQEILDCILLYVNDPIISILFESKYAFVQVRNNLDPLKNYLSYLIKYRWIKQLYWLSKQKLLSDTDILASALSDGSFAFVERCTGLIPFPTRYDSLNRLFQIAVRTCSVDKISFVLTTGFRPMVISDFRSLRMCNNTLNYLATVLPKEVIFTKEAAVVAMESDNDLFLENASRYMDVRNGLSDRDLIIAARKGAFNALKWYHKSCYCGKNNYYKCILDEYVYKAAVQSHCDDIVKWLRDETNCNIRRLGYPTVGWMDGFGHNGSYNTFWR